MLSKEPIAQEIRQIDNDWTGQESIYTQLQMRRIDATAFEYAGAREYGRFLAIPPCRRLEGFSAWLSNEAAR